MTRWKREATSTLRLMHDHHEYSQWHYHVLDAAAELGLVVGYRQYPNGSGDGSWDREWYVMTNQLTDVGGLRAVHDKADALMLRSEQGWWKLGEANP